MAERRVVFLPGTLCDRELFAPQIDRATAAGWTAEVWDYDGFRDLDAWAKAALSRAPDSFAAVGLSLGGIAAMALLRHAPERISRLMLLAANPGGDTAAGAARRERDFARAEKIGLTRFIAEEMIPRQLHPDAAANPEVREIVARMARRAGMATWRAQLDLVSTRTDSRRTLAALRMPVVIGCGDSDRICPPELHREMAELIPHAALELFPRCGHLPTLEAGDAVADALMRLLNA